MNETTMNTQEVMEEEVFETEVVNDTELAVTEAVEEDNTTSKVAVGAGLAALLVGGVLIGRKVIKKRKAKKAAATTEAVGLDELIAQLQQEQEKVATLKKTIESMVPQSFDDIDDED